MIVATWADVVSVAPASFLIGLGAGWIVSQRYAIVRRSDEAGSNRRSTDKGGPDG